MTINFKMLLCVLILIAGLNGDHSLAQVNQEPSISVSKLKYDFRFDAHPTGRANIDLNDLFRISIRDNKDRYLQPVFSLQDGTVIGTTHAFPVGEYRINVNVVDSDGNMAKTVTLPTLYVIDSIPTLEAIDVINVYSTDANTQIVDGEQRVTTTLNPPENLGNIYNERSSISLIDRVYGVKGWDYTVYSYIDENGILIRWSDFMSFQLEDGTPISTPHAFPMGENKVIVSAVNPSGTATAPITVIYNVQPLEDSPDGAPIVKTYRGTNHNGKDTFLAYAYFSDSQIPGDLRSLKIEDFIVENGTIVGTEYDEDPEGYLDYLFLEVKPHNANDVTIKIKAGASTTVFGKPTLASNLAVVPYVQSPESLIIEATQDAIIAFQAARANQVLTNQTDLTSFLTGGRANSARLSFAGGQGNVDIQTNGRVWTQITGSVSDAGTSDQSFFLATVGSHKTVSENLLIGAMAQFDRFESSDTDSSVSGNGWLIGPYVVAKHATQPLYFEGRALFGATDNKVSPFNTYSDSFKTKRHLIKAKLSGELEMGTLTLIPNASVAYTKDRQQQYTDSLSNVIPNQSVSIMQGTAGLSFRKGLQAKRGDLTLKGGISAIFSETSTDGGTGNVIPEYGNERAKIDLGLSFVGDQGLTYELGGYLDGLGASGYQTMGLNAGLNFDF